MERARSLARSYCPVCASASATACSALARELGPFKEEPKKTSIHLVNTSGFAGVHPRKSFLYLNVRMDRPLQGERIAKSEQVSKNRYHNEVKITSPDEVDAELAGWLKDAYALA